MRRRRLGSSALEVSEIGLGCMSLGRDDAASRAILQRALDLGINFFDTADLYDRGANERLVGQALRGQGDKVVIATKGGNRWTEGREGWSWDPSPAYLREAVQRSCERLGVETIDLYQLHGGTLDDPIDEIIATFEELKSAGRIREYGISSIRPTVIREWLARSQPACVMLQYSLLDRRPEESVLGLLEDRGVSALARGPVARGLLADPGRPPEAYLDRGADAVQRARQAAFDLATDQRTPAQVGLRFALTAPAVACVVAGASSRAQLEENAGAADGDLSPHERAALERAAPALRYRDHR